MDGGGLLSSVARTLLALVGVCALAWCMLALVARRGGLAARLSGGLGGRAPARVRVLERVALSPRRQLYLVQADARVFLLGAGEAGPLALLAELQEAPEISGRAGVPAATEVPGVAEVSSVTGLAEASSVTALADAGPPLPAADRARALG
jgi:hypothetical protein